MSAKEGFISRDRTFSATTISNLEPKAPRPSGCCANACKTYTIENWNHQTSFDEELYNRKRAAASKARMYEQRELAFRMLKKKGLTLNMSNSVSGDPNMTNKITDLVISARRAFVPKDLSEEER